MTIKVMDLDKKRENIINEEGIDNIEEQLKLFI